MSNKTIKAINFLAKPKHESVKFFLFGDEHALCYKTKHHCLKDQDLQLLEKVYIDLDDDNFESLLDQSLMTNSLFNEKKVVYVSLNKNRLNKELISKIQKIIEYETENILIVEILSLTKKAIEKELINNFDGNAIFIDCFHPYESEIKTFLETLFEISCKSFCLLDIASFINSSIFSLNGSSTGIEKSISSGLFVVIYSLNSLLFCSKSLLNVSSA